MDCPGGLAARVAISERVEASTLVLMDCPGGHIYFNESHARVVLQPLF